MGEVKLAANSPTITVTLKENIKSLSDVNVTVKTGYFEKSKQTFTGAATSFTGEELRTVTNQNILSALTVLDPAFKMMDNTTIGSNPNQIPDYQIRGSSSINTNIDEKYKGNPNVPVFMLDGFEVSIEKIYDLDPQRISGVTILKDAAALAIYGSRGANGVVVISTNAPKSGKLRITYNGTIDFEVANLSDYNLLGATDKLQYEKLAGIYTPLTNAVYIAEQYDAIYNERLKLVQQGTNTDWLKKPVKGVGISTKQALTIEGGDNTFRYGVDVSYNPQDGVMKGSSRNRKGINIRLNYNYKNVRFSNQTSFDHVSTENSPYGSFSTYAYLNPYYSPVDQYGNITKTLFVVNSVTSPSVTITNPLYNTTLNTVNTSAYDNFINNFGVEWRLNTSLRLTGGFSLNKKTQIVDNFKPADHTDFINSTIKGSYFKSTESSLQYEGNVGVGYTKNFNKHLLVVNANLNARQVSNDLYSVTAAGFPNDFMDHISMGIQYMDGTKPSGAESTSRLIGALTNANYSYDNRFLADFAIRYDGSSQFGSNKKWGAFWSAGLGWNIHNEAFLKDNTFITLLKLRGSIGFTGSQNFYAYQSQLTYNYIPNMSYNGYIGAIASAYGNQDLKWQKTYKRNVGVDFEFFKGKISGYFNYYFDTSQDVLVDVTMPPSLGFSTYKANLGEVTNNGYEINLKATVFSNPEKQQYINVFGSAVHNKNQLKEISNALKTYNDANDTENSSNSSAANKPSVRFVEGQSINTIWVVPSLGIDPATGQEVFVNKAGNTTNVWSADDYVPFASTDPKAEGTFGTNVGSNGFQLNVFFAYRLGGYLYNQTLVNRIENVNPNQNVDSRVFYDRWQNPGDISAFKGITNLSITRPTSRFVEKNNVMELKSINLSYLFSNRRFLKSIGVERLRVSAFANDIFRVSTIKAERGIDYPFAQHYAVALQMTF
ncbi:SusC/RagA family TonB-linked outer membrane protein [Pedobacter sp. MW01-1-1]|uniref:SusC/RagA family TonB-linked outer membrane protein n=1 Tax=Pedobacter sp. MW01-1-1 TaxID=3383027 RepID=UPI003FEF14B0